MKKTKTMKQKKQYRFFSNLLAARFPRYCHKKYRRKKENGKQKKSILEKNRQDQLKQYVHFQIGFSFVCM